ncbi:hypothetical protein [Ensifer sp. 22564]|uniref:hypothetical protein n=1 Tax=Sinorhizobium/Ensifer group TaxID=227292 RepID=UPI003F866BDD
MKIFDFSFPSTSEASSFAVLKDLHPLLPARTTVEAKLVDDVVVEISVLASEIV